MTTRGAHRCCNLSFFNQRALEKHQRYSPRHASIFECNSCDLSFKTPKLLDKHLCEAAAHRLPVECVSCKRRFASQGTLDEHLRFVQAHGGSSTCKGCNAEAACEEITTNSPSDLVQDKPILPRSSPQYRSHGQRLQGQAKSKPVIQAPAPFRCMRCNRNFANRDALNQHLKNSSVHAKSFRCHICDNDFLNKSAFDKHSCASTADSKRSITPTLNGSIPDEKMSHRDHSTGEIGPLPIRQPLVRCDKCQWIFVSQDSLSKHKCTSRKDSSDQQNSQLHVPSDASIQPKARRAARSYSHQSAQTRTKQPGSPKESPPDHSSSYPTTFNCAHCTRHFDSETVLEMHRHEGEPSILDQQREKLALHLTLESKPPPKFIPSGATTPLNRFFMAFKDFQYRPDAPCSEEFRRLEAFCGWSKQDPVRQKIWNIYQEALIEEYDTRWRNGGTMSAW